VLLDSIINFGESLWLHPLQRARSHAGKADLCLVLGSSLTVSPANEMPETVGKKRKAQLVICNLQSTPIDNLADLRVHSKADDLMVRVMEKLGVPIPPFILHRRLLVKLESQQDDRHQLTVGGVDVDGTPVTFLQSVKLEYNRRTARAEPFVINFRGELAPGTQLKLELQFMGHYGEPNLEIEHEVTEPGNSEALYLLAYNPSNGEWEVAKSSTTDEVDATGDETQRDDDSVLILSDGPEIPEDVRSTPAANIFPDLL
jgi:hypothetical protein